MDPAAIADLIRSDISKSVMLDHAEIPGTARKMAAASARGLGLSGLSARRATGFDAHLVMESQFAELCRSAGGVVIDGRVFPGTELRLHQPLMRYGRVLLGRATIHELNGLPSLNVTRSNGAALNRCLTGDLFDPTTDPNAPFHVLLLTLPDSRDLEKIAAIYVAVLSPTLDATLFMMPIDDFIAGYDDKAPPSDPTLIEDSDFGLAARAGVGPYAGEEQGADEGPAKKA